MAKHLNDGLRPAGRSRFRSPREQIRRAELHDLDPEVTGDPRPAPGEDQAERISEELKDLPLLYNGQLLPVQDIEKFGFKLTIYTATLMAFYLRMRDAMRELKATGSIARGAEFGMFEEMTSLLGVPEAMALGKKYGS